MGSTANWGIAGVAVLLILGCSPSGGEPPDSVDASDPELVARGASVYEQHCASCHGANLEGQPNWQQRDAEGMLPAPPHDASGHTWHHGNDQLFELTKLGTAAVVGGGYKSNMPGFAGVLDDGEIWAVLSYIKSRWPTDIQEAQATRQSAIRQ